jgi:hypothetical protein
MYRPPATRKSLVLHARGQDFESNGQLLLAILRAVLAKQLSDNNNTRLYLLEHIS